MKTLLVITDEQKAESMIAWAGRLSESYFGTLSFLCCFKGHPIIPMAPVPPERLVSGEALVQAVNKALHASELKNSKLFELRHPDPTAATLEVLEAGQFELLVINAESRVSEGDDIETFAERLFRFAPCASLLVDPGEPVPIEKSRVLVPMGSSMIKPSLEFALTLVRQGGTVVPLLVGPEYGVDSRATARKELELKIREVGMAMSDKFSPDVIVAPNTMQGLARAVRTGDTMLISSSTAQAMHRFRKTRSEKLSGAANDCTVAVYSPRRRERRDALKDWRATYLPKLNSTERVRVFDLILAGARFNPDFLVMMSLSTAIAALGLLQGSGAVVIGAMLVAPLMSPLIGAGFALVQGNIRLFRMSMLSIVIGIGFGFFLSILIGLINPNEDLSTEIMARITPEARDYLVAFLSGAAAAYAFARPGLASTLAGVAIAAALVPPLASAGIGLSLGTWSVFKGSAILFVTNLVAITLGAAATFRVLGIQGVRLGIGPALWARRAILVLVLSTLLLGAFLGYRSAARIVEGQARPMAYPISTVLYDALTHRIEKEPGLETILTGRSPFIEQGIQIGILLAADGPVPPELRRDLRQIVKETIGIEADVRIYTLQKAGVKSD